MAQATPLLLLSDILFLVSTVTRGERPLLFFVFISAELRNSNVFEAFRPDMADINDIDRK